VSPARSNKSLRLYGHDYSSPGAYFVTLCTQNRNQCLGSIEEGVLTLSKNGQIVSDLWKNLGEHYPNVVVDEHSILPEHLHGILLLFDVEPIAIPVGGGLKQSSRIRNDSFRPPPTASGKGFYALPEIIRWFKSLSAKIINTENHTLGLPFWQRSFYDHIIRDETELNAIRAYIASNPLQWPLDHEDHHSADLDFLRSISG
jgi:putative transposase